VWSIRSTIPPLYVLSHWQHNEDLFLEAARSYKPTIVDAEQDYLSTYKPRSILIAPVLPFGFSSEYQEIMLHFFKAPRRYNCKSTLSFNAIKNQMLINI
jgi:hypothetical protein